MQARPLPALAALALLALAVCALGAAAGSSGWGYVSADIVWQIRLPRVAAGFFAGACLALAGALMQLLTRNALADPYVLGVSGGASVGALAVLSLGLSAAGAGGGAGAGSGALAPSWGVALPPEWAVALGAAGGALAAAALLFALSWRVLAQAGRWAGPESSVALLLIGVMIGAACTALVSLMLALAPQGQLRGMVFWLLGDLNGATQWFGAAAALAVAMALTWPRARELDWLARGDAWAATLGVAVARRRRSVLLAAALATGAAVATAGAIGFVGLVVPHVLRLLGARQAALLLPASALGGGAFVVAVDTLARTVVAPLQLPVGVLAAAIGVPAFLALLLHGTRGGAQR